MVSLILRSRWGRIVFQKGENVTYLVAVLLMTSQAFAAPEEFVDLGAFDASIKVDIRGERNGRCIVHKKMAPSLSRVAQVLKLQNFGLKVIKCYKASTAGAQATEHEIRHSRGVSVDITAVDKTGQPMFGPSLDKAMELAKTAMTKEKFQSLSWFPEHYDMDEWKSFPQQNFSPPRKTRVAMSARAIWI